MEKSEVRNFFSTLTSGVSVQVNFINGELAQRDCVVFRSGTYTFSRTSVGRGKGGSLIAHFLTPEGNMLTLSTAQSDQILNLSSGGNMVGYSSVEEMPVVYPKDEQRAALIKEVAKHLVGTTGKRVRITSDVANFTGDFTVTRAVQMAGRSGQIVLNLVNSAGETQELWTYRHSGVIRTFELIRD